MDKKLLKPSLEKIGRLACDRVHEGFKRIWIRFRKIEDLNELCMVYEPMDKPARYKTADILNGADTQVVEALKELRLKFEKAGEEPWSSATIVIEAEGTFRLDLGYEDFDKIDFATWLAAWEKKYWGTLRFAHE